MIFLVFFEDPYAVFSLSNVDASFLHVNSHDFFSVQTQQYTDDVQCPMQPITGSPAHN